MLKEIIALTLPLAVAAAASAQDPGVLDKDWCTTLEVWKANDPLGSVPTAGTCPIRGNCDIPIIREAMSPTTPRPSR